MRCDVGFSLPVVMPSTSTLSPSTSPVARTGAPSASSARSNFVIRGGGGFWLSHTIEDDADTLQRPPIVGLKFGCLLVRFECFGQAIGLVVGLTKLIVRRGFRRIERHGTLQRLDGFLPTRQPAQG